MSLPEQRELSLLPALGDASHDGVPASGEVELEFRAIEEPEPGERWRASFDAMWPAYRTWYLKDGESARPDLATCRRMLADSMPELGPTFERLVSLADGDPLAARFLSMYKPPGFVVGCSQAAFTGSGGPALIRNYDYPASRLEGIVYSTSWTGRRVIGMSDCLWGLLDGINDAGLAASLTFGGRPQVGEGFGIPVVIRYLLEVCETVTEACAVLERVPIHAAQNVTLLDRSGDLATVRVGPDREPEVLNVPVATNHQRPDDWPDYARSVDTFGREQRLLELLATKGMNSDRLLRAFLDPPLYRSADDGGITTLYTAAYFPGDGRVEYRWPSHASSQSFTRFVEHRHTVSYDRATVAAGEAPA
jgi:predicted choloylglycine hydrolase